jgi:TPR repeat protein
VRGRDDGALSLTPEEALDLSLKYRNGDGVPVNPRQERKLIEVAAKGGLPEAMSALGHMILRRPKNAQEKKQGLRWLERAHRGGVFSAAHNLGRAAENDGDWVTAERWYRKAIDEGDSISGDRLAWHYLDQMDIRFHAKGVAILRRTVAKSRSTQAQFPGPTIELAKCYLNGRGVRKSVAMARKLLRQVASADADARQMLDGLDARKAKNRRTKLNR